ncbi:helix-turn-helix domain-containing protein [Mesoterricola silvestris]|uniref:Transcriptional regulator n=1 Tax=Mesoterricola silvestris TaxID=2927979 RepID=A0AA48GKZ0_9BACT|nr:short-chain fatty acyl-CoA regulator family protein [Mesoterricola silvestris]BDU73287.1 transcriptional regulator [Mesoterricola silvestris]
MADTAAPRPAPKLGAKVRALRRQEGLSQVQMAERLSISPSYLNLIEANKRPLTANLLILLAHAFKVDLKSFAPQEDQRVAEDLMEAFGDPLFDSLELPASEVRELAQTCPGLARAVFFLYQSYREGRRQMDTLSDQLSDGQGYASPATLLPSEAAGDFIQRSMNHFPALEAAAEALWSRAALDQDLLYTGLIEVFKGYGVKVRVHRAGDAPGILRRYDPESRVLSLSELLPPRSRAFQMAHQWALLALRELLDDLIQDPLVADDTARAMARVALANYFAGAVLMPYGAFFRAARAGRYDIELLSRRFEASFEQVCHRLTTLRRPGEEGVPFHFLRIDIAGNISKSFSASGIRFARYSGCCPRWNIHASFLTPGLIRTQISEMPDGVKYFCIARTLQKDTGTYRGQHAMQALGLGCEIAHARELVYSDGLVLEQPPVPIGVTCRLCDRADCEQRAFPPLHQGIQVEERVRRSSFFAHLGA